MGSELGIGSAGKMSDFVIGFNQEDLFLMSWGNETCLKIAKERKSHHCGFLRWQLSTEQMNWVNGNLVLVQASPLFSF